MNDYTIEIVSQGSMVHDRIRAQNGRKAVNSVRIRAMNHAERMESAGKLPRYVVEPTQQGAQVLVDDGAQLTLYATYKVRLKS